MRMWPVSPKVLCRKHLLGEHVEMHMFVGTIEKGKSIRGYIGKGLVDPKRITARHNQLAKEMVRRGYNHNSPLEFDSTYLPEYKLFWKEGREDLFGRCQECKNRQLKLNKEKHVSNNKTAERISFRTSTTFP